MKTTEPRVRTVARYGWRPDVPDVRDHRRVVPPAAKMPKTCFLQSRYMPGIRDQGQQGSCTGHATRSAVQYRRAAEGQVPQELSPRFAYYAARVVEGTTQQDAGAEIRDVIKAAGKYGAATEALCPYSDKVFATAPTSQAFAEALTDLVLRYERVPQTQQGIEHCVAAGDPVVLGFAVYESFENWSSFGDGTMPDPAGQMVGGHAVWICGYDPAGAWIGNSWGTEWGAVLPPAAAHPGERGYFRMPWHLLLDNNFADDIWAIDIVR